MTAEQVFSLASMTAVAGWLVLIAGVILNKPLLRDSIAGLWIPLALAALYALLILFFFARADGGFDTLAHVQLLFTSPWAALAGWVHYLCFDLAMGSLIARRTMKLGMNRLWLVPLLPLTFLFGPMGFLAFHGLTLAAAPRPATT